MGTLTQTARPSSSGDIGSWWSRNERKIIPYIFLAPFLLTFVLFTVYPAVDSFLLSFQRTRSLETREYVGLANYERLLTKDPRFIKSLENGAKFAIGTVIIQMPLALGVALLLNSPRVRFKVIARLAFFAPYITSAIVVGWIFTLVFDERYGLLNSLLGKVGIAGVDWLGDQNFVMPALIILGLWTWVGYNSLFFLAGLQNVPQELKEAARIDGANSFQVFWNVDIPFLRPVFVFVIITGLIGSFSLFTQPYLLFDSGSGPRDSGLFPLMYLYSQAFGGNLRMGYASAIGYLLTIIILIITGVQLLLFRFWKV